MNLCGRKTSPSSFTIPSARTSKSRYFISFFSRIIEMQPTYKSLHGFEEYSLWTHRNRYIFVRLKTSHFLICNFFSIFNFGCLFLVSRNATDFCMLIHYCTWLLFAVYGSFRIAFYMAVTFSVNDVTSTSVFTVWVPFTSFSCLVTLPWPSHFWTE